jgi:hypothetical protein
MNYSIGLAEKEKLVTQSYLLLAMNLISYICLAFLAKSLVFYDLFHKSIPFTDYGFLLLPLASCTLVLLLIMSWLYLDIEAEPLYGIFKTTARIDFFLRFVVIVITVILLEKIVNIDNEIYLYFFIGVSFCFNCFLEIRIVQTVKKTSDAKIEYIKELNLIRLSNEQIDKYKEVIKSEKKVFAIMICIIFFSFVLKNIFLLLIFFIIYSIAVLSFSKNMYFLLYKKNEAIHKIIINYVILLCGFILVLLLNQKIIVLKIHNLSPQELISLIGFFTFPLYKPVRNVYLSLKRSNNS